MREIDALPVPNFNFAAIQARAQQQRPAPRQLLLLSGLAVLVPALAAAAVLRFVPLQVTHFGGWTQVNGGTTKAYERPTPSTFAYLAKRAPYRVTWPIGLPPEKTLQTVIAGSSEVFIVDYRCAPKWQSRKMLWFVIIPRNYAAINAQLGQWLNDPHTFDHHTFTVFPVGDELVRLETNCLSAAQIAHVRSAMLAAGAAQR